MVPIDIWSRANPQLMILMGVSVVLLLFIDAPTLTQLGQKVEARLARVAGIAYIFLLVATFVIRTMRI